VKARIIAQHQQEQFVLAPDGTAVLAGQEVASGKIPDVAT
jgi:hypothetical protein